MTKTNLAQTTAKMQAVVSMLLPCPSVFAVVHLNQLYLRKPPPSASSLSSPSSTIVAMLEPQEKRRNYRAPISFDFMEEWISKNDNAVRTWPIYVGGVSLVAVLVNRNIARISPIADATSSQSRTDVLTLALAVTVILTGLVWISIQPKYSAPVQLQGVECNRVEASLPAKAACELYWVWESLSAITCCQALVIVYGRHCFLQVGLAAESASVKGEAMEVDAGNLVQGSLCHGIWRSGKQNYLANLALYPGRFELLFLPHNTQAVILQPLGDEGVMIVAGDTIRGFSESDQRWIAIIGEKVDATLSKFFSENHCSS